MREARHWTRLFALFRVVSYERSRLYIFLFMVTAIRGGIRVEGHHAARSENRAETRERGRIFNSP